MSPSPTPAIGLLNAQDLLVSTRPATVADLLDSLELGAPGEEFGITAALAAFYGLDARADLRRELAGRDVDEVIGVVLTAVEPFAALILEVFEFVGRLQARVGGDLEVELSTSQADALRLNVERFERYERSTVRRTERRVDLDKLLAIPRGAWAGWHDWYWPFHCVLQVDMPAQLDLCEGCPRPELIAEFAYVRKSLASLSDQARVRLDESGGARPLTNADYMVDRLATSWSQEVATRGHLTDYGHGCAMSRSDWMRDLWPKVQAEFNAAEVGGEFEDVRRLLALPYWKHRWQLYEVWMLGQVLDAIGLRRVELVTEDGVWPLPVGRSAKTAVALVPSIGATIWYQHQREPVAALFEGKEHRPEIIVEDADADVLLVVEAKARRGLDRVDAEAFLYPLLQWQPRSALLANYFAVNHAPPLTETSQGDCALASSSDCQPIGAGAESVRSWLRQQCAELLPSPTRVIVVDVSSSMPADDADDVVRALADDAHVARYVAFAERAALNRDAPTFDRRALGAGTELASAAAILQSDLREDLSSPTAVVHLVSDLDFEPGQLDAFAAAVKQLGARLEIHSWDPEVEAARRRSPVLGGGVLHIHGKRGL